MTFKIDSDRSLQIGADRISPRVHTSTDPDSDIQERLNAREEAKYTSDISELESDLKSNDSLLAVDNITTALDGASEALAAIEDLVKRQVDYATEGKGKAFGDPRLSTINTELNTIQTEISRIGREAGLASGSSSTPELTQALFSSATASGEVLLKVDSDVYRTHNAVGVGSAQAVLLNPNVSIDTPTNATNSETSLNQRLRTARFIKDGYEVASNKGASLLDIRLPESPLEEAGRADRLSTIEEAQALANKIVDDVARESEFAAEEANESIIVNSLDSDRVKNLVNSD